MQTCVMKFYKQKLINFFKHLHNTTLALFATSVHQNHRQAGGFLSRNRAICDNCRGRLSRRVRSAQFSTSFGDVVALKFNKHISSYSIVMEFNIQRPYSNLVYPKVEEKINKTQ